MTEKKSAQEAEDHWQTLDTAAEQIADSSESIPAETPRGDTYSTTVSGQGNTVEIKPLPLEHFGPYELIQQIGIGGMGVVYKARQVAIDRTVALKVLKRETLSSGDSTLDRFRLEALATSRIDHPGIITIYDVGEIDGRPFYSMQYVEGANLEELTHLGRLPDREAARLIVESAHALQEAHDCGILHRDLKPMNIMVDRESRQPRIADFGLAKLLDDEGSQTKEGDILGSPRYMAPEQVRNSYKVTNRADIYGLGATLYFLLTERAPHDGSTVLEVLHNVLDTEVTPPRRIRTDIDVDLELICLKAIEKKPEHRYQSASAFADDLTRWMNLEPISIRPLSRLERSVRWCRRNPVVAVLTALTVMSLLVASATSTIGYFKVSAALTQSEESHRHARQTVNEFFTTVSEDILLQQPAMQPLRKELLQRALDYYQGFLAERNNDPTLQEEIAETFFRIGRIQELIDNTETAQASYLQAEAIQRKMLEVDPQRDGLRLSLSNTLNALGSSRARSGELETAINSVEEAKQIRQQLLSLSPVDPELIRLTASAEMNLGILHRNQKKFEQAREEFKQALERRQPMLSSSKSSSKLRRDQAMCYYNLANLEIDADRIELAEPALQAAIALFTQIVSQSPEEFESRHRLGLAHRLQGELSLAQFDVEGAEESYVAARGDLQTLSAENPRVIPLKQELAEVNLLLAEVMFELPELKRAVEYLDDAVAHLSPLAESHTEVLPLLSQVYQTRGIVRVELNETAEAKQDLEQAISLLKALQVNDRQDPSIPLRLESIESLLKELTQNSSSGQAL